MKSLQISALLLLVSLCTGTPLVGYGFGNSSIDRGVYEFILDTIPEGETILELGSGWATGQLTKHYKMISIEHDKGWVGIYNSEYIYAPIVGKWYDPKIVKRSLEGKQYAAILVDGPPGYNPERMGRYDFLTYLELFDTNVFIIIDDIERPQERQLFEDLVKKLQRPYTIVGNHKCAGVIFPAT